MRLDKYARYGAGAGIVALILFGVGFFITPEPPDYNTPATDASAYFAEEQNELQVGIAFLAGAALFYLWFVGTLASVLRRAEGAPRLSAVAFGSAVVVVALFLAGITAVAVGALRPENMAASPELARALLDFGVLTVAAGSVVFAALYLVVAIVIFRYGGLPQWLGWLSLVTAVAVGLGLGALFDTDGAFAADGALGYWLPTIGFGAWTLIASLVLIDELGEGGGITGRVSEAVDRATGGRVRP